MASTLVFKAAFRRDLWRMSTELGPDFLGSLSSTHAAGDVPLRRVQNNTESRQRQDVTDQFPCEYPVFLFTAHRRLSSPHLCRYLLYEGHHFFILLFVFPSVTSSTQPLAHGESCRGAPAVFSHRLLQTFWRLITWELAGERGSHLNMWVYTYSRSSSHIWKQSKFHSSFHNPPECKFIWSLKSFPSMRTHLYSGKCDWPG